MERSSQVFATRTPVSELAGYARRLEQGFCERAAAANIHNRLVARNYTDLRRDTVPSARSTSYEMYHVARAHRSFVLGEIIFAIVRTAAEIAHRVHVRHQQRRKTGTIYNASRLRDDRSPRALLATHDLSQ